MYAYPGRSRSQRPGSAEAPPRHCSSRPSLPVQLNCIGWDWLILGSWHGHARRGSAAFIYFVDCGGGPQATGLDMPSAVEGAGSRWIQTASARPIDFRGVDSRLNRLDLTAQDYGVGCEISWIDRWIDFGRGGFACCCSSTDFLSGQWSGGVRVV